MALVREFTASNGVRVRIFDDCYANDTPAQRQAKKDNLNRVIEDIYQKACLRALEEERAAKEAAPATT